MELTAFSYNATIHVESLTVPGSLRVIQFPALSGLSGKIHLLIRDYHVTGVYELT